MKLASLFSVVFVLAMASAGIGADQPAAAGPAASGPESDGVVVLDNNTLWRHFAVSRCAYVRNAEGKLEPTDLAPLVLDKVRGSKVWVTVQPRPAASTEPSPLPPADWAGPAVDDSAWPRIRLPHSVYNKSEGRSDANRPQTREGATAVLLARGKFEVQDPARVKACRLSLDYWGGVVVYVNGQEVARGHLPKGNTDLLTLAEDYPLEALATPKGETLRAGDQQHRDRLALRDRGLRGLVIPAALLRRGVNVLAVEVHTAPSYITGVRGSAIPAWQPLGLLNARLMVSPAGAAIANVARPRGIQVWNCAPYDTVTAFDYGDLCEPLRPIVIRAARNGVFSGRLMVSSDQPVKGLKVSVSDLTEAGLGTKLPASAVCVRYAVHATEGKSYLPPHRFDGLLDAVPEEIPVSQAPPPAERFDGQAVDRKGLAPGAVAPLWFTARVPRDAKPGVYEGRVTVSADGLAPASTPLRVSVSGWTVPDPKDFRMVNLAAHSDEGPALHYGVPLWSDRHFELMGRSHALMAEVGSRLFSARLGIVDYRRGEPLMHWDRRPGGGFAHDFTVFDKYLDMAAKSVGTPRPLRLECWAADFPSNIPKEAWKSDAWKSGYPPSFVSIRDPATGRDQPFQVPGLLKDRVQESVSLWNRLRQPDWDTPELAAFWKPVFDGVLARLKARGWLDAAALGCRRAQGGVPAHLARLGRNLWPDGAWALLSHGAKRDMTHTETPWVRLRYAHAIFYFGIPEVRGYRELLKPRTGFQCDTYRWNWFDRSPLTDQRRVPEDIAMSGLDGVSDFGADLFPIRSGNRWGAPPHNSWPSGPGMTQMSFLYPGPDGPVATERFEMFREGVELTEALLFIERAIQEKRLSAALQQRAERELEARSHAFIMDWFSIRDMPAAEEDAKLLDLAGEVAREIQKSAK